MAEEKAAASPEKEEKKGEKQESLEEKVSSSSSAWGEIKDFGKKALAIGAVAALPFVYSPFAPAHVPSAQVTAYTVAAGRATSNLIQNKPALEGIVKEGAIGNAYSYPLASAFHGLNVLENRVTAGYGPAMGKAAKIGTTVFGLQPAITTFRTATTYGLGKRFLENVWPSIKTTFKYLSLAGAINVGYLYKFGIFTQMVVSAGISYCFGLVQSLRGGKGSIKNLYNAVNPFPYASATYSIGTRAARNAFSYSTTGMYGLGGGIREFFSGLASKPKAAPGPEKKQESRPEANAHYQKAPSEESGKLLNFPSEKARQYERKYEKKAA